MDFNQALNFVFEREGGQSNDPADRGGLTKFGISQKNNPDIDVANLTKDKAAQIYKARYWDPIQADTLPPEMRLAAFDTAVQHGVKPAISIIEKSGGDTGAIIKQREDLYRNIVANDPSQAKFAKGWSNRLALVSGASNPAPQQSDRHTEVANLTTALVKQGLGDNYVLSKLGDVGLRDEIAYARSQNYTPREIVARLGGERTAALLASQDKVKDQNGLVTAAQSVGDTASDMALAAEQRITFDEAEKKRLYDEAKAREQDPDRIARGDTMSGKIGAGAMKALPYAAAAFVPGGIPAMVAANAGAGALSGALTPTTEDGQATDNVLREAGMGAAGGAVGGLAAKGLTSMASKALRAPDAAAREATQAAAKAEGLPVSAATTSPMWRGVANALPENGSVLKFNSAADEAIAGKVAEGLGLQGYKGAIDTELLNTARPAIKQALDEVTDFSITLPQTMRSDLAPLLNGTNNPLTKGIAGNTVVKQAATNLIEAAEAGAPVTARLLQELNSELKNLAQSTAASAAERKAAGDLVGKINSTIKSGMGPEQRVAFDTANQQYASLKAVEKMVSASNDTGIVNPRQILQAVKSGRFKSAYLQGEAPFQDLGKIASELYGPANGRGLGSLIGKKLGNSTDAILGTAALVEPTGMGMGAFATKKAAELLAGKLATSQNPTMVRLLSRTNKDLDPATKAYIAKALSATAASASSP